MLPVTEVPVSGSVTTRVAVYTRKACASVFSPVARELPAGSTVTVQGTVVGDAVEGNAHWYHLDDDTFIWAGACLRPEPYPAFPESSKINWMAVVFEVR